MAPMIAAPITPPAAGAGNTGPFSGAQAGLAAIVTKATIATGRLARTNLHMVFLPIVERTNWEFAKRNILTILTQDSYQSSEVSNFNTLAWAAIPVRIFV